MHQVADQSHRFGFADSGPDSLVAWLNPKMDPRMRPSLGEIETSQRGPADRYSDEGHVKGVRNNPIVGLKVPKKVFKSEKGPRINLCVIK